MLALACLAVAVVGVRSVRSDLVPLGGLSILTAWRAGRRFCLYRLFTVITTDAPITRTINVPAGIPVDVPTSRRAAWMSWNSTEPPGVSSATYPATTGRIGGEGS